MTPAQLLCWSQKVITTNFNFPSPSSSHVSLKWLFSISYGDRLCKLCFFPPNNHEGEWWHAGFHLTTAIVGPTILTLPYAFRGLGWGLGFLCLTVMGMVTFYSYYLMSLVLEHCEKAGRRHIRFRELAADVLGRSAITIPLFLFSYSDSHILPVLIIMTFF